MAAEQRNQGFNPIDLLVGERDRHIEDLDKVVKANDILRNVNWTMYEYGPVKFFPDRFDFAAHVFDPGEYSLPEVPLETKLGEIQVHLSAKYGDVPFDEDIAEITEVSLHFRLGEQSSTFTVPRTDFRDNYNDSPSESEDEDTRIKKQAELLPSLEALTNAEYVLELIRGAYGKSDLVPNEKNPHVPKKRIE